MSELLQCQVDSSSNAGEMIKKIGANAHNMLESMDDIIWSVNPANDKFANLILRIKEYAIPLFENKDMDFSFIVPDELFHRTLSMTVRKSLFLIIKEAVNNLVKYSDATKVEIVFLLTDSGGLKVKVSDNGKGFNMASINPNRNGLKNMQARAAEIKGEIAVTSAVGRGTTVCLILKTISLYD